MLKTTVLLILNSQSPCSQFFLNYFFKQSKFLRIYLKELSYIIGALNWPYIEKNKNETGARWRVQYTSWNRPCEMIIILSLGLILFGIAKLSLTF